ncbi:hypothetical protein Pmani_000427 [Petrolisthes manimaculis]|uniref:Uncharacterized protein n=1 Tax=Petrolisthes manimaculis TaxID=1843537 RepID=A0AAE1QLP9_9EUCA|nr:hypothetical protein Pmani_000423 [Petrolisthes manimaculis]KAK4329199.1 hypothetical protein Pmani_000427 [Petrolisthes manimaculis]
MNVTLSKHPLYYKTNNQVEVYFHELNPDGGQYQNCLLLRYQGQGLLDTDCKKHCCTACHTTAGTTWTLRGTCEEEEVRQTENHLN